MGASVEELVGAADASGQQVDRYLYGQSEDACAAARAAYRAAIHYRAATVAGARLDNSVLRRKRALLYSREQLANDARGLAVGQRAQTWFWPLWLHYIALAGWLARQAGCEVEGLGDPEMQKADVAAALDPLREFRGW